MYLFSSEITSIPTVENILELVVPILDEKIDTDGSYEDNIPVLVCPEDENEFVEDLDHTFYIPFLSTRKLVMWREKNRMFLKVLTLSSDIDFELALDILESLREFGANTVYTDDEPETPISLDDLREVFTQDFHHNQNILALRDLMEMCQKDLECTISLSGPFHEFEFGNLLTSVLSKFEDENTRVDLLYDWMRTKQYFAINAAFEDIEISNSEETEDGSIETYIPIGEPVIVPKADQYTFFDNQGVIHSMKRTDFLYLNPPYENFKIIDEYWALAEITYEDIERLKNNVRTVITMAN